MSDNYEEDITQNQTIQTRSVIRESPLLKGSEITYETEKHLTEGAHPELAPYIVLQSQNEDFEEEN